MLNLRHIAAGILAMAVTFGAQAELSLKNLEDAKLEDMNALLGDLAHAMSKKMASDKKFKMAVMSRAMGAPGLTTLSAEQAPSVNLSDFLNSYAEEEDATGLTIQSADGDDSALMMAVYATRLVDAWKNAKDWSNYLDEDTINALYQKYQQNLLSMKMVLPAASSRGLSTLSAGSDIVVAAPQNKSALQALSSDGKQMIQGFVKGSPQNIAIDKKTHSATQPVLAINFDEAQAGQLEMALWNAYAGYSEDESLVNQKGEGTPQDNAQVNQLIEMSTSSYPKYEADDASGHLSKACFYGTKESEAYRLTRSKPKCEYCSYTHYKTNYLSHFQVKQTKTGFFDSFDGAEIYIVAVNAQRIREISQRYRGHYSEASINQLVSQSRAIKPIYITGVRENRMYSDKDYGFKSTTLWSDDSDSIGFMVLEYTPTIPSIFKWLTTLVASVVGTPFVGGSAAYNLIEIYNKNTAGYEQIDIIPRYFQNNRFYIYYSKQRRLTEAEITQELVGRDNNVRLFVQTGCVKLTLTKMALPRIF